MLQAPRPKTHTDTGEATRGPGPGPGGPRVKPWRLGTAVGRGRTKAQLRVLSILALAARAEGRARQAPPVLRCLSARAAPASRPRFYGRIQTATTAPACAGSCSCARFFWRDAAGPPIRETSGASAVLLSACPRRGLSQCTAYSTAGVQ